jgi:hypothetical protein
MRRTETFAQSIPSAHLDAYRFLAEELVRLHGSFLHRLFSALTRARYRGTDLPRAFSEWRKRASYLENWDLLSTEHKRQLLQASLEYGLYLQNSHLFYFLGRVLQNGRFFPADTDRLLSTFSSQTRVEATGPLRGSFFLFGDIEQKTLVVSDLAAWFDLLSLSFRFVVYVAEKPALAIDSTHLHLRTMALWQAALVEQAPATTTLTTPEMNAEAALRRDPSRELMERTRSDFVLVSPEGATLDYVAWRATLTRLWYDWSATKRSQRLPQAGFSSEQEQESEAAAS